MRDKLSEVAEILLPKRETLILVTVYRIDMRANRVSSLAEYSTPLDSLGFRGTLYVQSGYSPPGHKMLYTFGPF